MKIYEDGKKYKAKVAGVWNVFLSEWIGKEYDYLLITANDVEHDPMCVDFLVRCAEDNPNAGIITTRVTRDIEHFKKHFGQYEYTSKLTKNEPLDPATFLIRRGVIEKVGIADEQFPVEFVERDLIYRAKLAGYDCIQPDIILEYHPPISGTVGNDPLRLESAYNRYVAKWGGDANSEKFTHPYNDLSLDYTYHEREN